MAYKINIGEQTFEIGQDELANLDIASNANGYHILKDNHAYQVKVLQTDFNKKTLTLEVNGNQYDLKIEDEYDQLVKQMGLSAGASQKISSIKAPMPGLILDILVEPGQMIEKGTQLVILEAMKMENILKAEGEGVVKSIEVEKDAAVEKGQILIEME